MTQKFFKTNNVTTLQYLQDTVENFFAKRNQDENGHGQLPRPVFLKLNDLIKQYYRTLNGARQTNADEKEKIICGLVDAFFYFLLFANKGGFGLFSNSYQKNKKAVRDTRDIIYL